MVSLPLQARNGRPGGAGAMGAGGDVAPMTEERLTEIEGDFRAADTDLHHGYLLDGLALVGEVRRLRAENERLRADVASAEGCYHWRRNDCTPNDSE
jgi:hypothetical protein